jgi:soluble lytic murein transglycosylase
LEICYPKAFRDIVEPIAEKTGMEPSLLYALIRTESIFIPDIVSHAGAIGLTQLMPATGTEMARTLHRTAPGNEGKDFDVASLDFTDPHLNVNLGASYYMQLYERTGSRLLALLSYNGGIGRVNRWRKATRDLSEDLFLETVTLKETREYGKKVLAAEAVYDFLY